MRTIDTLLKSKSTHLIIALLIIASSFTIINCSKQTSSKIPITTTSEQAREYYLEGLALTDKLRGQEAVYFYLKALSEDNEFAMGYFMLAQSQNSPKRFFKYLNKAVELSVNVSDGERYWILGTEAGINGDIELQKKYITKIVEKYPNDERGHDLLANMLYGLQEYGAAIEEDKKAIAVNSDFSQPYNMLGYSYRNLGDYKSAEKYFLKYIELISNDPNPYDSYAELLLKMGKYESSIEYYRKALSVKPDFIPSIVGIATNLNLLNRHQEAIAELNLIKELSSRSGDLRTMHIAKVVSYIDNDNFSNATEALQTSISEAKKLNDYFLIGQDNDNLGFLNILYDEPQTALKHFELAMKYYEMSDISQDIKYLLRRQLFYNAGIVAFIENDLATLSMYTEKYAKEAYRTNTPNQLRNTYELAGFINLLKGKYKSAIKQFAKGNQQNTVILYYNGIAHEAFGDSVRANEIFESVANFNPLNDMQWSYIRHKALAKLSN